MDIHNASVEIDNINLALLKAQKLTLLYLIAKMEKNKKFTQEECDTVEGMICLCDAIQDYAVDALGFDKYEVKHLTREYYVEVNWRSKAGNALALSDTVEAYSDEEAQAILDNRVKKKRNFWKIDSGHCQLIE